VLIRSRTSPEDDASLTFPFGNNLLDGYDVVLDGVSDAAVGGGSDSSEREIYEAIEFSKETDTDFAHTAEIAGLLYWNICGNTAPSSSCRNRTSAYQRSLFVISSDEL
jgi:hypothetical protein